MEDEELVSGPLGLVSAIHPQRKFDDFSSYAWGCEVPEHPSWEKGNFLKGAIIEFVDLALSGVASEVGGVNGVEDGVLVN
jgi:hypothetical protein